MIDTKPFEKLNMPRMKALDVFEEYLEFRNTGFERLFADKKYKAALDEHPEVKTIKKLMIRAEERGRAFAAEKSILTIENDGTDFIFLVFMINKVFPYIFKEGEPSFTVDGNLMIKLYKDDTTEFVKFGLRNFMNLMSFLLPYVKGFLAGTPQYKTPDVTLNLKADGENPLALFRLGILATTEINHHGLTLETHVFKEHTKNTDKYATEMVYFMLFDKFTCWCDVDPISEVKDPSPIYYLLYSDCKYNIIHDKKGNMEYNFFIEVDEKADRYRNYVIDSDESIEFSEWMNSFNADRE